MDRLLFYATKEKDPVIAHKIFGKPTQKATGFQISLSEVI